MSENAPKNPFDAAERLLENAGVIPPDPDKREKLRVLPVISKLAEQVGLVLGKAPHKLFLRGDQVMEIAYDENQGDLDFLVMDENHFVSWVEQFIDFGSEKSVEDEDGEPTGKKKWVSRSLQPKTAKLILKADQFRKCLPRVVRKNRVRLPVLREATEQYPEGKLELLPSGWDERTGIYTFPNEIVIDETWTAERSISYWLKFFGEFPLPIVTVEVNGEKQTRLCPRGMAACIAGMLATFVDGLLPPNTLRMGFIYTANMPRSGKSLLGKAATAPILGTAAGGSLSKNDETLKSFVDSALLSGDGCLFFDNVKGYIESHILEGLMTMPHWKGRVMHTQRTFTVKNETTVFISGNNATVSSDLDGRFIWIELKSETADPNQRLHTWELDDHWLVDKKNRGQILSALWALARHWDVSGRPKPPTSIAGFRAWCDIIGGIVCSLSELSKGAIGNPLVKPEMALAGDKESKNVRRLLEVLVIEALRRKLMQGMKTDGDEEQPEIEDERVVTACRMRQIKVETAEFIPADVFHVAMSNGLFDWFLPELSPGKKVDDVLKQAERSRFGKLLVARSGERPGGLKYLIKIGDDQALWRFSFSGSGKTRKYHIERE